MYKCALAYAAAALRATEEVWAQVRVLRLGGRGAKARAARAVGRDVRSTVTMQLSLVAAAVILRLKFEQRMRACLQNGGEGGGGGSGSSGSVRRIECTQTHKPQRSNGSSCSTLL